MKKISILCLLLGLTTMCVFAERRPAKKLTNLRLELSQAEIAELQQRRAPAAYLADPDTVELSDAAYAIDYAQGDYYVTGEPAKGYYTFAIMNWDTDYPEIHLDVNAASKTQIQGQKEVNLEFSYLALDENTKLTLSKAFFWLKFTGVDPNLGDDLYDILAVVWASDGKVYRYKGNMAIYAYDENGDDINLEDEIDAEVVEPELPDDTPTAIDQIDSSSLQGGDRGRLIFRDGNVYILRGEKVYTIDGRKVR